MRVVLIAFLNLMQIPTLLFYGAAILIARGRRRRAGSVKPSFQMENQG